jgi:hypothetical protein
LGFESRTVRYEVYDENNVLIDSPEYELEANQIGTITKSISLNKIGHGSYTLKVKIVGIISGTEIPSNEITHKFLRYEEIVG